MRLRIGWLLLVAARLCVAQPGTITTLAGGYPLGDGGPATRAAICNPSALAVDDEGSLFILDSWDTRVRRITPDGVITTVLGDEGGGFSGDGGPARLARVNFAWGDQFGIVFDHAGNLYLSDSWNQRIRKVNKAGIVSTFAGTGQWGSGGDGGPALEAQFLFPGPLAVDTQGNLFVVDQNNSRVRRIDLNGIINTVAGNGTAGFSGDGGPAKDAQLSRPGGIAVDAEGNLFIADRGNNRIRRVAPDGTISTFVGGGTRGITNGMQATQASLPQPNGGLALDAQGNLYVNSGNRVYRISRSGVLEYFAGNGTNGWSGDGGPALSASLRSGQGIAFDSAGNLYRADYTGFIRRVDTTGRIDTIAGVGATWGDGGPAVLAWTSRPNEIAVDPDGNVFTTNYSMVRRIAPDGKIHIHSGDPDGCVGIPSTGSIPARAACTGDSGLTSDPSGNLFLYQIDSDNRFRVVKIDRDARASIAPGSRSDQVQVQWGYQMTSAMAVDTSENLYLTDSMNHRIVKVTPDGEVSVFAGTGTAGFSGDGGPAAKAQLNNPIRLATDAAGNVYIADSSNRRVRKVTPNGIITTFAGNGEWDFNGDGIAATEAQLGNTGALAVDLMGNVYIASGNRIRKVTPRGIITTVAGNGVWGYGGDGGPATQASFRGASNLAVDGRGNLYIAENSSYRIRRVQGSAPFAVSPSALVFAYSLGAPPAQRSLNVSVPERESRPFAVSVSVAGSIIWLTATPVSGTTSSGGDAVVTVSANPTGLPKGVYTGRVQISNPSTGDQVSVPVTMTVSGTPQQLRLSQTGFLFSALEGGKVPPSQSLGVVNAGVGSMNWTATTSALSGGSRWLAATPVAGTSTAGSVASTAQISVNPAGLTPGVYYGLVSVSAPGVDNSPQSAVVLLAVQAKDKPPGPVVDPNGMIFTGAPDGEAPAPQSITIANITDTDLGFFAEVAFPDGKYWFWPGMTNGNVRAGESLRFEIAPYALRGIPQGVYRGEITFRFWPVPATVRVSLALVVAPGAGTSTPKAAGRAAAPACAATKLVPVFRSPGGDFSVNAGWPMSVQVEVVDDCGRQMNSGQVVVSFNSNDPAISLTPVGTGRWTGAWASRETRAMGLEMTAKASMIEPPLSGEVRVKGFQSEDAEQPVISPGGVMNSANYRVSAPVAPGGLTAIFGAKLAKLTASNDQPLWPAELAGTSVMIGGRPMPLQFVSDGQINGVLPFGLAENTPHQLIVRKGLAYSLPEQVLVAASEPAVFSVDGSGAGQGQAYLITDEGFRLPDASWPARPGDMLVVFATGLGSVTPSVQDGAAGPSDSPAQVVARVRATIQGRDANVTFAGLAPAMVGIYRINVTVPAGLQTDASAPLVILAGEQSASSPVAVMVRGADAEEY